MFNNNDKNLHQWIAFVKNAFVHEIIQFAYDNNLFANWKVKVKFHWTTLISVPIYQVVPVLHSVHKRNPDAKQEVHLKAFGRDFHLSLEPTERLWSGEHLPMLTVTRNDSQPNGLDYEIVPEVSIFSEKRKKNWI